VPPGRRAVPAGHQLATATPRQGSLIVVSAPGAITGEVAGEPLHFRDGKALAAVPLSATDSTEIETLSVR